MGLKRMVTGIMTLKMLNRPHTSMHDITEGCKGTSWGVLSCALECLAMSVSGVSYAKPALHHSYVASHGDFRKLF